MNKSLNVFLSVLLCFVLCLGVLTSLNTTDDSAPQHYQTEYTSSIPTHTGTPTVYFGVGARGNDLAVPMSSRRSSREQYLQSSWRSIGVADLQFFSKSANSKGMLSLPSLQGGDGGRLFTHMSSSQTMKSFGGGGNGGSVSMSGEQVKSSRPYVASASGVSVSMPSISMYAYNANRTASSAVSDGLASSVSGDLAVASAIPYAGIGNTTVAGPLGMKGRRNLPGIGGEYLGWLSSELWGYGDGYGTFGGGSEGVTLEMLKELYIKATGDTDFSNQQDWEAFLAWFNSNQSDDQFGWYWVPMSDAIPFVLLLCLVYVVVVSRRNKIAKKVKAEI